MSLYKIVFVGLSVPYENQNWTSGWALRAHYPSIKKLKDSYEIVGVLNSTKSSAQHAIDSLDLTKAKALASLDDLKAENYDILVVSVKVPGHVDYVMPALKSGKKVICEWPLAKNLEEAQHVINIVEPQNLQNAVVLQARFSPGIRKVKSLLKDGILGRIFSTEFKGVNSRFVESLAPYFASKENGANVLTIPFGHCIDAVLYAFGSSFDELSGKIDTLFELPKRTAPDYVAVQGVLTNGVHLQGLFRAGIVNDISEAFRWEIHGELGDLLITSESPYVEFARFKISYVLHADNVIHEVEVGDENYDYTVDNVYALYEAFKLRGNKSKAQGFDEEGYPTFEDALILHKLLNSICISSETGEVIKF